MCFFLVSPTVKFFKDLRNICRVALSIFSLGPQHRIFGLTNQVREVQLRPSYVVIPASATPKIPFFKRSFIMIDNGALDLPRAFAKYVGVAALTVNCYLFMFSFCFFNIKYNNLDRNSSSKS